jgi:hypothetical protein
MLNESSELSYLMSLMPPAATVKDTSRSGRSGLHRLVNLQ